MKRILLLVVAASALAAPAPADPEGGAKAKAAAPSVNTKSFDDWLVRCPAAPKPLPCDAVQLLLEPKSKRRVLSISVAYEQAAGREVVRIVLPLGVWLPHGVTIVAGDTRIENAVIRRCEPFGCVVEGLLDTKLREAMRKGGDAKIVVFDRARTPFDLKFSLKGYAAAEDHMVTETKKIPIAKPAAASP